MIDVKKYGFKNLLKNDFKVMGADHYTLKDTFEVSNSSISLFKACRFQWFLRYVLGVKHVLTPEYFDDGDIFHCSLERHYKGRELQRIKKYIRLRYKDLAEKSIMRSPKIVEALETRTVTLQGMVSGYHQVYEEDLKIWRVVFSEKEFCVEFVDSSGQKFLYKGKIDMKIQETDTGDYYIVEHKTAGQIGVQYVSRLLMDSQVLTYLAMDSHNSKNDPLWGAGGVPKGCIYNVIKKPGIKLKQKETRQAYLKRLAEEYTDPNKYSRYFYRDKIKHKKRRLIKFIKEIKDIVPEMRAVAIEMSSAHKNERACSDYGGCAYKDICLKGSLKGTHMAYYKVDPELHPELSRR